MKEQENSWAAFIMRLNSENMSTALLAGLVLTFLLGVSFFVGMLMGQQQGREVGDTNAGVYSTIACAYAKDAGRTLPEWCKK